MRTQKVLADHYAANGWPWAESTGAGRSGVDITGMPGLAVEVKARTGFEPIAWLRQADREQGLPFVVFRPNGMGETRVGDWGVLMTVEHHTQLLRDAGYGSPEQKSPDAEGDSQRQGDEEDQEADQRSDRLDEAEDGQRLTKGSKQVGHGIQGKS